MKKLKNIYLLFIAMLLLTACSENNFDNSDLSHKTTEGKLSSPPLKA